MRILPVCALLLAFAAGCGGSDAASAPPALHEGTVQVMSREQLVVDVSASDPIKLGKNDLDVTFEDASVELVSVSALMPAHGHGSPAPAIERTSTGYRVRDVVFYMSGRWEVRFELRAGTRDDEALVTVDIP